MFGDEGPAEDARTIERLEAENKRLREVVKMAAKLRTDQGCDPDHHVLVVAAQAALEGGG